MAAKQRRGKRKPKRRIRWLALILLCALALVYGYGYVCARIVRVTYADVYVEGLKPGQDGARILFVSDFKLKDDTDARHAAALMGRLYELSPDVVILGGDYTAYGMTDRLTMEAREQSQQVNDRLRGARQRFFAALKQYNSSGRLFVIEGDADANVPGLAEDVTLCNGILLRDAVGYVTIGGGTLTIVGAKDYGGAGTHSFRHVTREETVIAVTHNPRAYASLATVTDASGRAVADIILAGHTLGGQIRVFGQTLAPGLADRDSEFVAGRYSNIGVNMLVSRGVGTEWLPIRIGASPDALLITLKSA